MIARKSLISRWSNSVGAENVNTIAVIGRMTQKDTLFHHNSRREQRNHQIDNSVSDLDPSGWLATDQISGNWVLYGLCQSCGAACKNIRWDQLSLGRGVLSISELVEQLPGADQAEVLGLHRLALDEGERLCLQRVVQDVAHHDLVLMGGIREARGEVEAIADDGKTGVVQRAHGDELHLAHRHTDMDAARGLEVVDLALPFAGDGRADVQQARGGAH